MAARLHPNNHIAVVAEGGVKVYGIGLVRLKRCVGSLCNRLFVNAVYYVPV